MPMISRSGPATAEALRRLRSWGSHMDLADGLETGSPYFHLHPPNLALHTEVWRSWEKCTDRHIRTGGKGLLSGWSGSSVLTYNVYAASLPGLLGDLDEGGGIGPNAVYKLRRATDLSLRERFVSPKRWINQSTSL